MNASKLALVLGLAVVSCSAPKEVAYFQDTNEKKVVETNVDGRIRLIPGDKMSIIVKSRDAELTSMFNLPYFTQRIGMAAEIRSNYSPGIAGYSVDEKGNINFPVLGEIRAEGLTRSELAEIIESALIEKSLVKDPVVSVDFMNHYVSVIGEVAKPGRYNIDRDEFTILDALSTAGDLTIYGVRTNVKVIRNEGNRNTAYTVNLCSTDSLLNSPAYYLRQNDVIYVEPNKMRTRQSTVNGNNVLSTSFWISLSSLAITALLAVKQFM